MPRKPVIIALLVAIAIVLASIWLLRPPSASPSEGQQPVLDVDAASIVSMELIGGQGDRGRVERTPIGWQHVGQGGMPWAVSDGRARAAARVLADLQGRPVENAQDLPPVAATLSIRDARGRTLALGLREPLLGGRRVVDRVAADASVQRFAVDEPLYEAFIETGMAAWRDPGLLGALPGRAARLELSRGTSRLELARVDGRWSLRSPLATRASEPAVDALITALARLRVERFDQPAPPLVGADDPVTITLEADTVVPSQDRQQPDRVIERLVLTLHGAADTGGRLTLVGVSRQREPRAAGAQPQELGSTYVALDLEPLERVALEPRGYVARTALDGDASLIAGFTLNGRAYERTADGWAENGVELAADRAAALDALATVLTQSPMTGVELTDQPQPLGRSSAPVSIEARTITGDVIGPAEGLALLVIETPQGASGVLIVGDGVTREYTDEQTLAVARAALVLAMEAAAASETPGEG